MTAVHLRNFIGGACALLIVGALIATNPFALGVAGGIAWNRDFQKATLVDFYEANYAEVCPAYRDASTWDKWFNSRIRNKSWCADYIDRL